MTPNNSEFKVHLNNRELIFSNVPLRFNTGTEINKFSQKNNKTVRETISSPRYFKFSNQIQRNYVSSLDKPLGEFLFELKTQNNSFYKEFLNQHGDNVYCNFLIDDQRVMNAKGLYIYMVDGHIKYIGRCLDNFRNRINQGYGKIHPKNCFIDGQSTNCHLNSLISQNRDRVFLFVCKLSDDKEIVYLEKVLINKFQPEWNVSLS